MNEKKAFTLIELFGVIVIIVFLTTLILVGARRAQAKAKDGVIIQELRETRTIAHMILIEKGTYEGLCDSENTLNDKNSNYPVLKEIEEKIKRYNGENPVTCYAISDSFCVSSPLNLENGFCVDSHGKASSSEIDCDSTYFVCY